MSKTALLKLGVYYEIFKNSAQLFNTPQETGREYRGMGNTTRLPCISGKNSLLQPSLGTLSSTACHIKNLDIIKYIFN